MAVTDQPTCRGCSKPITFKQKASGEGWDRFNPDGTPHVHERRGGGGGKSPAELREIRRMSVLKSAAEFAASRPDLKSADVLAIAGRWLAWVEDKGGEQTA